MQYVPPDFESPPVLLIRTTMAFRESKSMLFSLIQLSATFFRKATSALLSTQEEYEELPEVEATETAANDASLFEHIHVLVFSPEFNFTFALHRSI